MPKEMFSDIASRVLLIRRTVGIADQRAKTLRRETLFGGKSCDRPWP